MMIRPRAKRDRKQKRTWSGLSGSAIPSTARETEGAGLLLLSMSRVASFSSRRRFLFLVRKPARSTASRQTPERGEGDVRTAVPRAVRMNHKTCRDRALRQAASFPRSILCDDATPAVYPRKNVKMQHHHYLHILGNPLVEIPHPLDVSSWPLTSGAEANHQGQLGGSARVGVGVDGSSLQAHG